MNVNTTNNGAASGIQATGFAGPSNAAPAATSASTLPTAPVVLACAAFGPGNYPVPGTLTNLSTEERRKYKDYVDTANLIVAINQSLPGWRHNNKYERARWAVILPLYQQQRTSSMSVPTTAGSLASTFQTLKRALKSYIDLNAGRAAPPERQPLPSGREKTHGGRRDVGVKKPVVDRSGVRSMDVKGSWGQVEEFEEENLEFEEGTDEMEVKWINATIDTLKAELNVLSGGRFVQESDDSEDYEDFGDA